MRSLFRVLILLLLTTVYSHAGDLSVKYGLGASQSVKAKSSEKIFMVAWENKLNDHTLHYSVNAGMYFDSARQVNAGYGFIGIGPRISPFSWMWVENMLGAGFITRRDDLLGGPFQFSIDFGAGFLEPSTDVRIGVFFKHISSAGIYQPNHGRNFWMVSFSIPLYIDL